MWTEEEEHGGREDGMHKGPGAGATSVHSRSRQMARGAGRSAFDEEWWEVRLGGGEGRGGRRISRRQLTSIKAAGGKLSRKIRAEKGVQVQLNHDGREIID